MKPPPPRIQIIIKIQKRAVKTQNQFSNVVVSTIQKHAKMTCKNDYKYLNLYSTSHSKINKII